MDTVAASLQMAARVLQSRSSSPKLDAEILLCKVLGTNRAALIARGDETVPEPSRRAYLELLDRRAQGAPVAYLTGAREFWSLDLSVTPDVHRELASRDLDGLDSRFRGAVAAS